MSRHWSKTEMSELIRLYKLHPELYDANHEHYYNRDRRELALQFILEKLNVEGLTIDALKMKIKMMRSQYSKEKLKLEARRRGGDNDYKPLLWSFPLLTFLDKHQKPVAEYWDESLDKKPMVKTVEYVTNATEFTKKLESAAITSLDRINHYMSEEIKQSCFGNFVNEELEEIQDRRIRSDVKWQIQLILKKALEKDQSKVIEQEKIRQLKQGIGISDFIATTSISNGGASSQLNKNDHRQMEILDMEEPSSPVSPASPTKSYDTDDISSNADLVEESLKKICNSDDDI